MSFALRNIPLRYKFWLLNGVSFLGMLVLVLFFLFDTYTKQYAAAVTIAQARVTSAALAGETPTGDITSAGELPLFAIDAGTGRILFNHADLPDTDVLKLARTTPSSGIVALSDSGELPDPRSPASWFDSTTAAAVHPLANGVWIGTPIEPQTFYELWLHEAPFYALLVAVLMTVVLVVSQTLIQFVQRSVRRLGEAMHQVQHDADLTVRVAVESCDELGAMTQAFNAMQDATERVVEQMGRAADHLDGATERLTHVTTRTREQMERQQAETDQVATAMNEMTATVTEVARNASQAEAVANRSGDVASDGRATVTQVVDAISELASNISVSRQTIEELSEASATVSSVTNVIQEIAEQTNLLALNASIEAARAGDHGRGFAVVADEVRTLAQRTQKSTEEIRAIIERLGTIADQAMSVMTRSCEQAEATVNHAGEAGEALTAITRSVQEINDLNTLIATASEEQSAVAEEINRNLVAIRDAALEALEASNASAAESTELAQMAAGINRSIHHFRTDKGDQ